MSAGDGRRSRRFLPRDPRVEEPYRLTPQLAFRVALLGFFALALFAVLFLRLWALQVLSGEKYAQAANNNRLRTLRLEAPRGPIVDRHGRALVVNVPGTRVELWPADLPKSWPEQRDELRRLSKIVGVPVGTILDRMNAHAGDPLTPVVVQTRPARGPGVVRVRARQRVSRRSHRRQLPAQISATSRSAHRFWATSARSPSPS